MICISSIWGIAQEILRFIFEVIIGGLFVSVVWWYFSYKRTRVKIEFSEGLQKRNTVGDDPIKYDLRVKIGNFGKTDLIEISIMPIISIKTYYAYLGIGYDNYLNYLRGTKYMKDNNYPPSGGNFNIMVISLTETTLTAFSKSLYKPEIRKKARKRKLSVMDIFEAYPEDAELVIHLFGNDAVTGTRRMFSSKKYRIDDIEFKKFKDNSLDFIED